MFAYCEGNINTCVCVVSRKHIRLYWKLRCEFLLRWCPVVRVRSPTLPRAPRHTALRRSQGTGLYTCYHCHSNHMNTLEPKHHAVFVCLDKRLVKHTNFRKNNFKQLLCRTIFNFTNLLGKMAVGSISSYIQTSENYWLIRSALGSRVKNKWQLIDTVSVGLES